MGNSAPRKRKAPSAEEGDVEVETKKSRKSPKKQVEKRLRRFRPHPPASFQVIYERATQQRFYVIDRTRSDNTASGSYPEESIDIAGSTGNIYRVHIAQTPTCNCPHALKGNQCKHVVYVLSRVLRARYELVYQLALLPSELREILDNAPSPLQGGKDKNKNENKNENRKAIEGDCPICFTALEEGAEEEEKIVYCRATCGQNMHAECFDMWAATKRKNRTTSRSSGSDNGVTCPMCRSPWQADEDDDNIVKKIRKNTSRGRIGPDGYVNIADQLGISGERDSSTYHFGSGYGRYFGYRARSYYR